MAMQSSAIEMRSPEVSSMSISRAVGWLETSWARRSRSSVVLPMAETTTTTSSPARRVRTMCSATARMRSGSATEVPPNFCTSKPTTGDSTGGRVRNFRQMGPILGLVSPSVNSPAVPKASKRERQRLNREARREAMMEAEKRQKREAHRPQPGVPPGAARHPLRGAPAHPEQQQQQQVDDQDRVGPHQLRHDLRHRAPAKATKTDLQKPGMGIDTTKQYTAVIHTTEGDMTIALDAEQAPKSVNSFVYLASRTSTTAPPSTGSSPTSSTRAATRQGDGTGGPGYTLPDEPPTGRLHGRFASAMANAGRGHHGLAVLPRRERQRRQATRAAVHYSALGHDGRRRPRRRPEDQHVRRAPTARRAEGTIEDDHDQRDVPVTDRAKTLLGGQPLDRRAGRVGRRAVGAVERDRAGTRDRPDGATLDRARSRRRSPRGPRRAAGGRSNARGGGRRQCRDAGTPPGSTPHPGRRCTRRPGDRPSGRTGASPPHPTPRAHRRHGTRPGSPRRAPSP